MKIRGMFKHMFFGLSGELLLSFFCASLVRVSRNNPFALVRGTRNNLSALVRVTRNNPSTLQLFTSQKKAATTIVTVAAAPTSATSFVASGFPFI